MADARDTYLQSQVLTATPQKLRLMLLDGALRFLNAANAELQKPEARDDSVVSESLIRARAIVSELLSTIRDDGSESAKKMVGLYLFLFQSLSEAQLQSRLERVGEVISVLEIERETWRQVCEKYPDAPDADEWEQSRPREIKAADPAITSAFPTSAAPAPPADAPRASGGFSADA